VRSHLIYLYRISSLSTRAHQEIRRRIIDLDLPPGAIVREDVLQRDLGIGRTPIREALQRLAREQFVTVLPRRGMVVTPIDVTDLALLHETRAVLEPYAARLACARGGARDWAAIREALAAADQPGATPVDLLGVDRRCHELVWAAASNRFLTDTLDTLYAQSDRVWHLYVADVVDTAHAVHEHAEILAALVDGDQTRAAALAESHVRGFDAQVRAAITRRLEPPLAAS
jgi:DNA-binding GntR family transcriptional regulator